MKFFVCFVVVLPLFRGYYIITIVIENSDNNARVMKRGREMEDAAVDHKIISFLTHE